MQLVPKSETQRHKISDELELEITVYEDKRQKTYTAYLIGENAEPTPTHLTNAEIRESGAMPDMIRAMEHDVSGVPTIDPVEAYKAVESGVVDAYKAVENTVVGAYQKVEDAMVDKLFRREGETVEEAKKRLSGENK